jgi:Uma2 family endonuclease
MGLPLRKEDRRFTYGDYLTWPDEERWEIIDGLVYDMSPAPSVEHQRMLRELSRQFSNYLVGKTCETFFAPFDVRLPRGDEADEDVTTVVQPDLVVICDRARIDQKGARGAPDLVVEILSPHTARKDMREKFSLYERVGVREYWVVHPEEKMITVYTLSDAGRYGRPDAYGPGDELKVGVFEDFTLDLDMVLSA